MFIIMHGHSLHITCFRKIYQSSSSSTKNEIFTFSIQIFIKLKEGIRKMRLVRFLNIKINNDFLRKVNFCFRFSKWSKNFQNQAHIFFEEKIDAFFFVECISDTFRARESSQGADKSELSKSI